MKYYDWFSVKKIIEDTALKNNLWRVVCTCENGKVSKARVEVPSNLNGVTKSLDWTQAYLDFQRTLADDFWGSVTLAGVKHTLLIFETSRVEKP